MSPCTLVGARLDDALMSLMNALLGVPVDASLVISMDISVNVLVDALLDTSLHGLICCPDNAVTNTTADVHIVPTVAWPGTPYDVPLFRYRIQPYRTCSNTARCATQCKACLETRNFRRHYRNLLPLRLKQMPYP